MSESAGQRYAIDTSNTWYNVRLPLCRVTLKQLASSECTKEHIDDLFNEAQRVVEEEGQQRARDDRRWYMQHFHSRGTTSDRIASAAVALSENDFMFFPDSFSILFEVARNDSHHYEAALKALGALWPRLLPPRPLKRFVQQYFPTLPPKEEELERKRVLAYWYIEDFLKRMYTQFLAVAETAMRDKLAVRRDAWLSTLGRVLSTVTESRPVVISILVDKLGDPLVSVSHKAYKILVEMLSQSSMHQAMLQTELERVAFMKGVSSKTVKYCVNVMNQLIFNKDERKLALKCVNSYLNLFRQVILAEEIDESLITAIIVGLRRAFPYTGSEFSLLESHLNSLFVLANAGNMFQRVSSLTLLQQLLKAGKFQVGSARHQEAKAGFVSRWYRSLYHLLQISPKQMPQSSQLSSFFALLHKALRTDTNIPRVAAFVHRILQRCMYHNEAFVCAALMFVAGMMQAHPELKVLLSRPPQNGAAKGSEEIKSYNPKLLEPSFARAQQHSLYVLNALTHHYHPSVVRIAVLLLLGEEIVFDTHPLDDLTMGNFLQLFRSTGTAVQENSADVPNASRTQDIGVFRRAKHVPNIPSANDASFISADLSAVDVSALFLHRYAVQHQRFLEAQQRRKHSPWDGTNVLQEDEGDDEEESEKPEETVKKTRPEPVSQLKINTTEALFGPETTHGTAAVAETTAEEVAEMGTEENAEPAEEDFAEGFDAEVSDSDLDWGSDDERQYDELEQSDEESDSLGEYDEDEDLEFADSALAKRSREDDTGAGELAAMLEKNMEEPKRKKKKGEMRWERKALSSSGGKKFIRGRN